MPSQLQVPTSADSLRIGKRAIVATRDELADDRTGAIYDFLMGTAALAWVREALADRDKFQAVYFLTAKGDDLTNYVKQRYGIDRVLDTQGIGTALFVRASAAAGAGTIWKGTRFLVSGPRSGATVYQVTANATVGVSDLAVPVVIGAVDFGPGVAVGGASGVVADPLFDSFVATQVACRDGTVYESAPAFRARVVQALLDARPGYPTAIRNTLYAAGAAQVVLFPSNYQSVDSGISVAYVGDFGGNASNALVIAGRIAVESSRVLGADLEIFGMSVSALAVDLTVSLWDDPSKFDQNALVSAFVAGVLQYFDDPRNSFAYKVDGIRGAVQRVSSAAQSVTVNSPVADATFSSTAWPATLTRYRPTANTVTVALQGPS